MMRRFTLAVLVVGVLVVPGAAHGRTSDVEIGWVATPVSASQTWFRVVNTDQTNHLRLLSLHGISFDITGIKAVRAMGALAGPSCVLTTATTRFHYLDCSGDLPPNSSLILVVDTSGSGADFEIAASDSTDPSTLEYSGDAVDTTPLLPATGTFTSRGSSTSQITFTSGGNGYDEVEILPYGLTITKVDSITPTANSSCDPEGPGLDCSIALAANVTGSVTFETSGASGTPSADIVLSGGDGLADVLVTQVAGKPLTYDLVAGARPAVVTYKRGQRASPRPIRFTVTNSATAGDASPPVRVTVKASEVSAKKLFGASLACRPSARTTVALPPGKSTTACTLTFSRPNVVARKAGKLNLVFSVACARSAEKSCANNVARATIVVK